MKCEWAVHNALLEKYHDDEWGTPVHNDQLLFEHLILDCFQAGLSWQTILNKRENFREALDGFDVEKISAYDQEKIDSLLANSGIIRNRLKINATINNAKMFIGIQQEYGSFDAYIWGFSKGKTIQNKYTAWKEIPATTKLSDTVSASLKDHGFKFVGSTIIYAFMQAVGIVNDHCLSCFRYKELQD